MQNFTLETWICVRGKGGRVDDAKDEKSWHVDQSFRFLRDVDHDTSF